MSDRAVSRRKALALAAGTAGLATLPANAAGARERLKITRVELFRVVVPMQPDIINSPEFSPDSLSQFPSLPKFILKLHTDSGIVGIGETARDLKEANVRRNVEAVTGKNAFELNLARLELPDGGSYAGFEMALYDAVGKALGWPVYRLLGGLAQRKVLVNYWCGRKNPTDIRRVAERAVGGHFRGIKIKGRPGDPVVKTVEAIAAVAPELKITVDFNAHHHTAAEFLPIGKGLDAAGNLLVIEDPITKSDMAGYRELRAQLKTPLALHLGNPRQMIAAIRENACALFNTGPSPSMASFVANCYLAGAAGMAVWHGSGHELGILDAAMLHSCAAAPNCTLPSDILSYQRVDDLIVHPIEIRDSYAIVPDRPGLGVELDEDAIGRYQVRA
ncbi:MAG TPA: mandelate racemase/muconate lactonizing enzyme family protein [Bryobacteraceae bacterium]|nr:mandelate racemase/muconate lactonizing enzyme family protein [Bryobacteraceae bacterium]